MIYDPVLCRMLDEGSCPALEAADGWRLLQAPEGHWLAHRPWTGAVRRLQGPELALVAEREARERLLARCALLDGRAGGLEETAAAAALQASRAAPGVAEARAAGYSSRVIERALRTLDDEPSDDEAFAGVRVVRLSVPTTPHPSLS